MYSLAIESSTITFGAVLFEVRATSGTAVSTVAPGGFAVLLTYDIGNPPLARFPVASGAQLVMGPGEWTYTGDTSNSTPLTSSYYVILDMGTENPEGNHYSFVASVAGESGTTTVTGLP